MSQLSSKLRKVQGGLLFWCPGCKESHYVTTDGGGAWTWDGDADRPTFRPSVLVTSGHYLPNHKGACWCTYNAEHPEAPAPFTCHRCHSLALSQFG